MKHEIKIVASVAVFVFSGNMTYNNMIGSREDVRRKIEEDLAGYSGTKFLLDLSNANVIDSTGVGFIMSVFKTLRERKGTCAILHRDNSKLKGMETAGFLPSINFYKDEAEAIAALEKQ